MGKQAPAPPNYQQVAEQQTQANRPNQTNAFGGQVRWEQGPNGQWTQTQGFGGLLGGASSALQGQAAAALGQPADFSQFNVGTGDEARQQAVDAAYQQAASRLDPQWAQREEQMRTQLLNQGLDPSSEAYQNAMGNLGRERNDAYSGAMNSAIGQGTAAGESAFRQNLMSAQANLANLLRGRQLPLEEMQQLQGLLQQAGVPQTNDLMTGAVAQGNADMARWQAENGANADVAGGAASLLGTGLSFLPLLLSDERAKQNIRRLGVDAIPGVPWATYEYRHRPGVRELGVIAQDLQRVAPEYVHPRADGLLTVDYSFLRGAHA